MRNRFFIYIKIFLAATLLLMIVQLMAHLLFLGSPVLKQNLINAGIGGIVFAVFFGTIYIEELKKSLSNNINIDRYKVKHTETITIQANEEDVIELVKNKVNKKKSKLLEEGESEDEYTLKYRTPMSYKSWGEIVFIQIRNHNHPDITTEITSIPMLSTTMLDYGKNKNNVHFIRRILYHNLSE